MKKAVYTFVMTATLIGVLVACNKSDDSGSTNGGIAVTPNQTCNIPGVTTCNPSIYQQYDSQFVNYNWTTTNGFCGCPVGYRPIMNMQWGISCAPYTFFQTSYFTYQGYQYSDVMYPAQNGQVMNIPLASYSPAANTPYAGNCYTQAATVCDVRSNNPSTGVSTQCNNMGSCRAAGGATYMGFCTNGLGHDFYSGGGTLGNCLRRTGPYGTYINICNYQFNGYNPNNLGTGIIR